MKLSAQKIWLTAFAISSVLLLAVLAVFIYTWLRPGPDFVVWPRDEARELARANGAVLDKVASPSVVPDFDPKRDYFVGPASAKLKLIVYSDFDCPFCKSFNPTLTELAKLYPKDLAIIYRNFPIEAHPNALAAANAWLCAGEQGKWQIAKDALYAMVDKSFEQYLVMGKNLGLDQAKFEDCLKSSKYQEQILAEKADAKKAGVSGTPTSFLNGLILPGAYQLEDFADASGNTRKGLKSLINQQLAK